MRNRLPGSCADCGKTVAAGAGHFERRAGRFVVRHIECVEIARAVKAKREACDA